MTSFPAQGQRGAFRRYLAGLLAADRAQQDAHRAGERRADCRCQRRGGAGAAMVPLRIDLGRGGGHPRRVEVTPRRSRRPHPTRPACWVIDETGDRKWGTKTAHVGRQYLGSIGKVDSGVVTRGGSCGPTTASTGRWRWSCSHPSSTPSPWASATPRFRTKPQIALELVSQALAALWSVPRGGGRQLLRRERHLHAPGWPQLGVGYVLALPTLPCAGGRRRGDQFARGGGDRTALGSQAAGRLAAGRAALPRRAHRTWWALEGLVRDRMARPGRRAVIATTDPATLPGDTTWYLDDAAAGWSADLAEIVRLYGLRNWVEQRYKQVKAAWAERVPSPQGPWRCAAIGRWSGARSASAGGRRPEAAPGPTRCPPLLVSNAGTRPPTRGEKGDRIRSPSPPVELLAVALRRLRAWLEPALVHVAATGAAGGRRPRRRRSKPCSTGYTTAARSCSMTPP